MAQVTPEEVGLGEFNPSGNSTREFAFLVAYYIKELQTQGISINPGDINIGAVELKDATTDTRTIVTPAGALTVNADGTRTADNAVSTGNPDYVGGLAVAGSSYAPAYTAGDRAVVPIDKDSGGLLSHIRTLTTTDQITATPVGNLANHISTATTTVVKSGAGTLERIVINKHVATGVITVYDNTAASGTVLAIITVGAALLTDPPITGIYGIPFSTGLTIVTSQAEDLTIVYR